jgi:hypothetical protein
MFLGWHANGKCKERLEYEYELSVRTIFCFRFRFPWYLGKQEMRDIQNKIVLACLHNLSQHLLHERRG